MSVKRWDCRSGIMGEDLYEDPEGDWVSYSDYAALGMEAERLRRIAFRAGAMIPAPCFNCGYNGENYFSPKVHPCAEMHHRLTERSEP